MCPANDDKSDGSENDSGNGGEKDNGSGKDPTDDVVKDIIGPPVTITDIDTYGGAEEKVVKRGKS